MWDIKLIDTDNSMLVTRGKGAWGEEEEGKESQMYSVERNLSLGGEHTTHHTDAVLKNCTPEDYLMLLTKVTPIQIIKIKKIQGLQEK